jgi:hypothetical protein
MQRCRCFRPRRSIRRDGLRALPTGRSRTVRGEYQYDLGYFDDETCRLEPIDNPFGPKCY